MTDEEESSIFRGHGIPKPQLAVLTDPRFKRDP